MSSAASIGIFLAPSIRSPRSPIQFRIQDYPAQYFHTKATFNIVLVPAYSKDDWDGDGLLNSEEGDKDNDGSIDISENETDPFNPFTGITVINGLTVLDGYPKQITDTDPDGDGLHCKWETYYGTSSESWDSYPDFDGYPDGFEVAHGMDPLRAEPPEFKMVPLAFDPRLGESLNMYAYARDKTGHIPRRGEFFPDHTEYYPSLPPVGYSCSGYHISYPSGLYYADSFGLAQCSVSMPATLMADTAGHNILYPADDGPNPSYGHPAWFGVPYSSCSPFDYGYPCDPGSACSCTATITHFLARPQGTKVSAVGSTSIDSKNTNAIGYSTSSPAFYNQICIQASETVTISPVRTAPVANVLVGFTVDRATGTLPQDFTDVRLSKKWSFVDPYEYPLTNPFRADAAAGDTVTKLDIYTDADGKACAMYYVGNTSNFNYKMRATIDQVHSVNFTLHNYTPLAVAFEPNGRFTYAIPDNILFGDTIRPFMYLRQYTKAISTCSGACVYNDAPKKNQRVVFTIYKAGAAFGDTVNSTTDQNGRVAVPNAINVEYGDTMSVHSSNPSGWLAYWKGVAASSVKIKMQRLDANYNYYELLEGGTVSASFWDWHRDKAVIVSIENQPTQFLNMDLVEYADFPGRLLIAPLPRRDTEDAYGTQLPVIFPTSGRKYFFAVPKEAVPGHFELSLLKPSDFTLLDSTTAHLTTDHFDFTCDREDRPVNEGPSTPATRECSGNFSLVLSDGRTVDHVFARSGEHLIDGGTYYTALPDGIYYVSEIGRKPLNSVKCDNYHNCWFADLRPIPFDDNVGRFREDLGIHPVIGNGLTHGCIGLDKTVNTYYLYTFIDSFHRKYGDTLEVKVHP